MPLGWVQHVEEARTVTLSMWSLYGHQAAIVGGVPVALLSFRLILAAPRKVRLFLDFASLFGIAYWTAVITTFLHDPTFGTGVSRSSLGPAVAGYMLIAISASAILVTLYFDLR